MNPTSPRFHAQLFDPVMLWTDLAVKSAEMMISSGQVINSRVSQMARAGANPSPRDMREMVLMGSEKIKAANESAVAVASRMQQANWQVAARAWQQWFSVMGAMAALGTSRSFGEVMARQNRLVNAFSRSQHTHSLLSSDAARLAHAAIKPVHAAATANARRLSRLKRR